jgi:hypothetical protein
VIKLNVTIEEQKEGIAITHSTPPSENATMLERMMYHRLKTALDVMLMIQGGEFINVPVTPEMMQNPERN